MNISAVFFGVMIFTVLILVSFLGFAFLSLALVRKSKRYRALIRDLKAQNKYEEWAEQHKSLVITDRVIQYSSIIFVLALLLFLGSVKEVISVPRIVALISGILVYAFWPFSFISMLVLARLYKKVPEV